MSRNSVANLPATWPPPYPRHRPLSAAEARDLDAAATAEHGIPSLHLMEHAARGVAEIAATLTSAAERVLVCCGPGNNGGDGYGVARFLRSWGRGVQVLKMSRAVPGSEDAAFQRRLAEAMGPVHDLWDAPEGLEEALQRGPALVVDALFGVGLDRPLEGPFRGWVETLAASDVRVLAVDIPSGMDANTGAPMPTCVRAAVTATMAAPKQGFAPEARGEADAGRVVEVDIGLPRPLLRPYEVALGGD